MNGTLTVTKELPLQVRETFREARNSPLGLVQVADELGFAYLDQDIDFGAIGKNEIFQNIKFIILTEYFSVPLDREFGMDYSMVDKPIPIAEAILSQEVAMKISLYEPRAQFTEINFVRDILAGKLNPNVVVTLLTTEELPSSVAPALTIPTAINAPAGTTIEEVDLPTFFESLIEMARVPGPPGPIGLQGEAATIEVGTTTTGAEGTDAIVTNVGDTSAAVFDFTIPKGDKGDQGTGITIKGTVPNSGALPSTGNQPGDMWIAADTGHGWTWNGTAWVDAGPIQGPVGPEGPQGPAATATAGTTTTGAPGTNANVVNAGTSSAAVFNFTIPRGDVGAQGTQGIQGATGNTGSQGIPGNAATIAVGTTTTGVPGTNANVSNSGSSSAAVFNFTIPRGDVGSQGIQGVQGTTGTQGPAGPANNLTVAATNTGAPGTNASVVIAGTTPNQNLTFTIPRGDAGTTGTAGANGSNAFTTTTANFDVPAIGNSVLVNLVDAAWITLGQMVAVQTAGGSLADALSFEVTAKAGNQVTLKNIGTDWISGGGGSGDMLKSVYDTNSNNIVDRAEVADTLGEITIYTYQDHFLTGSDGSYTNWTAVQGTGAAKAQVASIADHPGIYALSTGTQAGAAATGYGFITSGNAYLYGTGALAFRAVFKGPATKPTSTAANLSKIYLGMGTQPVNGTYPGADFVGFVFDPSSGMANAANNWGFLTRKASVNTYTDTGYAYSTANWIDVSFYVDATGAYYKAYTWGGTAPAKSAAITSNVPLATIPLCLVWHVVNGAAGTTSYQSFIDSWEVAYRGDTVVPVFRGSNLIRNF